MTTITEEEIERVESAIKNCERPDNDGLFRYYMTEDEMTEFIPRLILAYKEQRDYLAGRPILKTEWEELQTQLSAQDATIAKMRECLRHYADIIWEIGVKKREILDEGAGEDGIKYVYDFGAKARQCLKEAGE